MPLSEEEQKRLDQLAADLFAEDPSLADTLGGRKQRAIHKRKAAAAFGLFGLGLLLLLAGIKYTWLVSVLGFFVMFLAVLISLKAWEVVEIDAKATVKPKIKVNPNDFMKLMEERWQKRQEGGF